MKKVDIHKILRLSGKWFFLPVLIYFVVFCIYTWPWITNFNSGFFTDMGDGYQNIWNMWWVNKSITELGDLPWYTQYLHFPHGTSLVAQTMNAFNGFVAIPLLTFLKLNQAFNIMVIFSFVMGGVSAFWLAYEFCKKYWSAILGGAIFTFSAYHFAHAIGHMQLVSLEWLPLFLLLWWRFLKNPRYRTAIAAALVLGLVVLCDFYYFFYCVITAGIMFIYLWRTKQTKINRNLIKKSAAFVVSSIVFVVPLPLALMWQNHQDKLLGSHPTEMFGMDVFAPFIYGAFWRFASLTKWYWENTTDAPSESSVHLGLVVVGIVIFSWFIRKKLINVWLWYIVLLVFGILSLGLHPMAWGNRANSIPLPYLFLQKIFPPLELSGVPIRMMVMVTLAVAVITAMVVAKIKFNSWWKKALGIVLLLIMIIEYWPARLPITPASYPQYAYFIKQLPEGSEVVNNAAYSAPKALYDQTLHEKPMVLGYITRMPKSVEDKSWIITHAILTGQYDRLCRDFGARYYAATPNQAIQTTYPIIYQDDQAIIYDLKNSPNCD